MKIKLHRSAEKFLDGLNKQQVARILRALHKLPEGNVVSMKDWPGKFRLRIGDWCALYEYREGGVYVWEIDNRGSTIYKRR